MSCYQDLADILARQSSLNTRQYTVRSPLKGLLEAVVYLNAS